MAQIHKLSPTQHIIGSISNFVKAQKLGAAD